MIEFLEDMSKIYEIIIYTSAEKNYADFILQLIESKGKYFAHRLYKQQCLFKLGEYIFKNLEILCGNRNIKDIVIVDNTVRCFALSVQNGIPIKDYKGINEDEELVFLAQYLRELVYQEDMRNKIKEDFAAFLYEHYQVS